METKRFLIILAVVLGTMVVSLSSFIAGMFIPRPGFAPGNMPPAAMQPGNQPPAANQPQPQPQRPVLPGKKPSEYKIGKSYTRAMEGTKPVLAVFYVDWCHFCQAFMPKFKELSGTYRKNLSFTTVNVEDPKNAAIAKEYDIKAYPTVMFINPKTKEKEPVDSSAFATVDTMKQVIDKYLKSH